MAQTIGTIITVEEHVLHGGFGSAVLEVLNRHQLNTVKLCCLGIPDNFVEHGTQKMLRAKYGIDADGIGAAVKKVINGDYSSIAQNRKSAFG
jgi:1-deoxy-D-xylulose-5-phosphate synthase